MPIFGGVWRERSFPLPSPAPNMNLPREVPGRDVGLRTVSTTIGRSLGQNRRIAESRAALDASLPARNGYNTAEPPRTLQDVLTDWNDPASVPAGPKSPWLVLLGLGVVAWIVS